MYNREDFPRFCVDVNGDGMADLVGFYASGVHVSFSNGRADFDEPVLLS